jgi:cytoskeletal protein CcmA (bactofilin family)
VTANGFLEVNGRIEGPLTCRSVVIGEKGQVSGSVVGQRVVVDGCVEGEILCDDVLLKSSAHVVGDIICRSVSFEKGAFFEGRLVPTRETSTTILPKRAPPVEHRVEEPVTLSEESLPKKANSATAFVDGKEVFVAALIGITLIGLMTWLIVG